MAQLSVPVPIPYSNGSGDDGMASAAKFPHTRAQLAALGRQHRRLEGDEVEENVAPWLLRKVVRYLENEDEEELKQELKTAYPGMNSEAIEQGVLDLMHKHRDDVAGVPFLFLTPTRRPISRPSSRASHNANSVPSSPHLHNLQYRRPHTPITSPLAPMYSPSSSPILLHAHVSSPYTASLPASPLSSPRLLNAKAHEFRPIPRPLSAASCNPALLRNDTPSPDLWSHNSPRATSNLAIAAPLLPEQYRSITPSSSLRSSTMNFQDDDPVDDDDPFDPFQNNLINTLSAISISDFDAHQWPPPEHLDTLEGNRYYNPYQPKDPGADLSSSSEDTTLLTDGMTPLDVLSSVFGSTLAPSELEEALLANGYDFEMAMGWLIDRSLPQQIRPQSPANRPLVNKQFIQVGRDAAAGSRGRGYPLQQVVPPPAGRGAPPRYVNGRPAPNGNRVCRYFVAGECLRADCRFSHDLERALCRFWLRGTCAKNEACEFLHHIPKDVDISAVNAALSRANIPPGTGPLANYYSAQNNSNASSMDMEFPVLGYEGGGGGNNNNNNGLAGIRGRNKPPYLDPGRTRFAAAVKKPASVMVPPEPAQRGENLHHQSAIVAPRPSPRTKLRAPTLMPTLPTGEALNSIYMTYRSRALQLGAARNACLSRAADAWRRGDGAAAKRFSREGHELNAKMGTEMADAAAKLVRERARVAEQAVRVRDANWSDDPGDRGARGKVCGGGLGVCLGVARVAVGDGKSSAEERTEVMLDLHGLHSNEATEVLEKFLLALEREHFYGLAYAIVGEEKHTGTQDVARGASRLRLAAGVKEWLHRWGYPWNERDGIICIDALTHASE